VIDVVPIDVARLNFVQLSFVPLNFVPLNFVIPNAVRDLEVAVPSDYRSLALLGMTKTCRDDKDLFVPLNFVIPNAVRDLEVAVLSDYRSLALLGMTKACRDDKETEEGTAQAVTRIGMLRVEVAAEASARFPSRFFDATPVRANDFSQSCVEGPRMLPSR
jgi:hypothetical protein